MKCLFCGREVSDGKTRCPHCGAESAPVSETSNPVLKAGQPQTEVSVPSGTTDPVCTENAQDALNYLPTARAVGFTDARPSDFTKRTEISPTQTAADSGQLTSKRRKQKNKFGTADLAKIAVLTAISYILYLFVKFPLPFFPPFLDIQFSDLPALIAGFAMGPAQGCTVILIKCLLKMPMSSTACVGEVGDILIGIAFVLPAALFYRMRKGKGSAAIGLTIGMAFSVAVAIVVNRLMLIPFYAKVFGFDALVGMVSGLYPGITQATFYNYYLWIAVLPFNVLRCLICGVLTYLVYKPLSKIMHWEVQEKSAVKQKMKPQDVCWQIGSVLCPFAGVGAWCYYRKAEKVLAQKIMVMTVVGFAVYVSVLFLLLINYGVIKI